MKIILINPPWKNTNNVPPLGLAYLGAVLKKQGFEVTVIDANAINAKYTNKDVFEQVKKYSPDLIGITIYTAFAKNAYSLMNMLSSLNKVIVVGGPHPTAVSYEPFRYPANIVVKGEGEKTIVELVKTLKNGGSLYDVKGILFKDKKGKIIETPPQSPVENLDSLPYPARDLFDPKLYTKRAGSNLYGAILTSRGCPGRCTFCSKAVFGNSYRFRNAKNIYNEIIYLIKKYKIYNFAFADDAFTVNKERVDELCNLIIDNDLNIKWFCATRVNTLTKELLSKMEKAGCQLIDVGVEHGDDESLGRMRKYITMEQVKTVHLWKKKLNIKFISNFIFGFPWDTVETVRKTLEAARKFGTDGTNAGYLIPYPGAKEYEENKDKYGFSEWWLKRGGLDPYELKEIALGKKLSLPFIKLPDDVEREIEYALRDIHSRLISKKRYQRLWWFFQLRKLMYRMSPKLEKKASAEILRLYGQLRNKILS